MASVGCTALAVLGMPAPSCIGVPEWAFAVVKGGSQFRAATRCDLPDRDEATCLDQMHCPDGTQVAFIKMPWRSVRAYDGRIIAPNSYTHILDCAAPEKDTQ